MANELEFPDYSKGTLPTEDGGSAYDWIKGFGKSAVESIPELIGYTPSTETQQFRQDNPVSGFISELGGMAVPYTGWFKAVSYLPKLASGVDKVAKLGTSPIAKGMLRGAAEIAPFEAGRVAVSQTPLGGDRSLGDMTAGALTNVALSAGIGGLFHGIGAAGTRDPSIESIFPGIDIGAPWALQARHMRTAIDSGSFVEPEAIGRANAKLADTLRKARTEELPESYKYVGPISHDAVVPEAKTDNIERQLNRLFRAKPENEERALQIRKFATGANRDFGSDIAWKAEAEAASLPLGFEDKGQYFRNISFAKTANGEVSGVKAAQSIDDQLTRNMRAVGEGNFLTREADDGMFIIARKYQGEAGKGTIDDKWVLFKTDQPGTFLPESDKWAKYQAAIGAWTPGANLAASAGPVYDATKGYMEQFPLRNYMALAREPSGVADVVEKLLPKGVRGEQNELVARAGEAVKEYLTPRIYQFKKSWRANWITNATKVSYDQAETLTQQIMNGKIAVDPGKSLFYSGLMQNKGEGVEGLLPVRDMVKGLSEADLLQFHKIWKDGTPVAKLPEMMVKGEISPETMKFAQMLDQIEKYTWGNVNKVEVAVGQKPTEALEGHYGLSRSWEGDTRIVLTNDAGQVVALAGGTNRRSAQASAESMLKEHSDWHFKQEFSLSQDAEALSKYLKDSDVSPKVLNPSFLLERQDIKGFKYDTQPFTKEEFLESYENALRGRNKYQANLATTDMMGPQLDRLMSEDPAALRMVTARMNDYAGVQSTFGKWQNRVSDHLLGPIIGPNSATKIVGITNTALFDLQLGALKLSYPIVNALQFVQTVMPEVAFVLGKTPDASVAGRYSFFAAGGTKGPVGGMGVLSPIKMMYQSLKDMRAPDKGLSEAFERAVNDRVIDPRIVENYIGASATKLSDMRGVLKGEQSFVGWLRALSEFLPAETERFSRSHAFTVGYGMARDFLQQSGKKLNADEMYSFARQFTENTMYLYGTADKPRIFTTPAGSLMGVFKNWMFHYIAAMGEFAKEGFAHNNWAPLMWQTGGTFALGGLAATPLYAAANGFSKAFSNKSMLQMTYDQFGEGADGVMFGLPAVLSGVSLSSGVDVPAVSNPMRDASSLFSIAAWGRVQAVGKAAGAAFDHWQTTGEHPAYDRGVRELLMRAFAPTTVYRTMGAMEPDQITSLGTGYPLVKDVPFHHRVLYGFGFNPTELQRGQAVSEELYSTHEKLKGQEKKLGQAWAAAELEGNGAQMATIMRQGMVWGVDISNVIKEGMYDIDQRRKDLVERRLRPKDIPNYRALLDVQKGE